MKLFNPELGNAIIREISKGAPYHYVAEAHGLRETLLHAWIDQGLNDAENDLVTPLADFATRLRRGELRLINSALKEIRQQPKYWKNHAWLLEHVYPRFYGSNVIELERIQRELATLSVFVQNQTKLTTMNKPVVTLVDDTVNCSDTTQGDDDGIS